MLNFNIEISPSPKFNKEGIRKELFELYTGREPDKNKDLPNRN